jgi:hypothetical protein
LGGEVLLWTESESLKHKLIRDASRFANTAQDEQPPYKYVTAEGDVTGIGMQPQRWLSTDYSK